MQISEALSILNANFEYDADHKYFDTYAILPNKNTWKGDCDDYAITFAWLVSDRSILKFIWNLLSFKILLWYCKAPNGERHIIVKYDGLFFDNWQKTGKTKQEYIYLGYDIKYPLLFPFVFLKLILSYTILRGFQ